MDRRLIFEKDRGLKASHYVENSTVPEADVRAVLGDELTRCDLELPSLGELDVIRHYLGLCERNFSVDTQFYPLGSCTMKYNPKINEYAAGLDGFCGVHPFQSQDDSQGSLELMYDLSRLLSEITGMEAFSLQPGSGAQAELAGLLMIRKFHQLKGVKKTKVIIPDSAHGTNPATVSMCGYETVVVPSTSDGLIDIDRLKEVVNEETAAIMLTNPNTLGLFEENILEVSRIIRQKGGLLYYDGANFNALLAQTKPSLMGFDIIHLNLHKTFSAPHGCGGPGSGVIGASKELSQYLPVPIVSQHRNKFYLDYDLKYSIGRLRSFYGNFSVLVRAYAYILRLGKEGLTRVSENSVLSANYLKEKLRSYYHVAYPKRCMHEVVFSAQAQKDRGVSALDIAKRLIDYNIHPPTIYFPLIVKEALMVEPTETESRKTLDSFIKAMIAINREIDYNRQALKEAPQTACVRRVDEARAGRSPDLKWQKPGD